MGIYQSIVDWVSGTPQKRPSAPPARRTPSNDRFGYISYEIKPDDVADVLLRAERGEIGPLQEVYMKMVSQDTHLRSLVKNHLATVLSNYPLRVSPARSRSADAMAAAEMMESVLSNPEFKARKWIWSASLVHYTGVRIYENVMEVEEGEGGDPMTMIRRMKLVPPTRYRFEANRYEPNFGELHILPADGSDEKGRAVSSYPEGSLTVITEHDDEGFYDLGGAGRTVLFWYCVKHFNAKWWADFNEIYGEPKRVGYYEPWSSDKDRENLKGFLEQLGRSAWAMFPTDAEVELVQAELGQVQTYGDLVRVADKQMSHALVGQIGSSGRDQHGSYGEVEKLDSVRWGIVAGIAGNVEEDFRPTVKFLCRANINPEFADRDLPRVYVVVPDPEEKRTKVELFRGALEIGMEVPRQWAHDELGIPEARDGEDMLTPDSLLRRMDGASQPENASDSESGTNTQVENSVDSDEN